MKYTALFLFFTAFATFFACKSADPAIVQQLESTAQSFQSSQDSIGKMVGMLREFNFRQQIGSGMSLVPSEVVPDEEAVQIYQGMLRRVELHQNSLNLARTECDSMLLNYKSGKVEKGAVEKWLQTWDESQKNMAMIIEAAKRKMTEINARTGK